MFELALDRKNASGALNTHGFTSKSTFPSGRIDPGPSALPYRSPPMMIATTPAGAPYRALTGWRGPSGPASSVVATTPADAINA